MVISLKTISSAARPPSVIAIVSASSARVARALIASVTSECASLGPSSSARWARLAVAAVRAAEASLRAAWSWASLTSITAAADSDIVFDFDADWGNDESWAPVTYDYVSLSDRSRQTLSQEIRLASSEAGRIFGGTTDWLAGVYLLDLEDELVTVNRNLENNYNPWGVGWSDRNDWTERRGVDVRVLTEEENPEFDVLLWVGCAGAFDDRYQRVVAATGAIGAAGG